MVHWPATASVSQSESPSRQTKRERGDGRLIGMVGAVLVHSTRQSLPARPANPGASARRGAAAVATVRRRSVTAGRSPGWVRARRPPRGRRAPQWGRGPCGPSRGSARRPDRGVALARLTRAFVRAVAWGARGACGCSPVNTGYPPPSSSDG